MLKNIIEIKGLKKTFDLGRNQVNALAGIDLEINPGEFVVIYGPSGCGKTTLLSLLAGIDKPSEGQVVVRGTDIYKLKERELARYRRSKVGMVFQQFNLVPTLSALDNVALPLIFSGVNRKKAYRRATELLEVVGLNERIMHKPTELSGGQQQRVAIARSLVANPWILLADEPTGNLDLKSGQEIMQLLQIINSWGRTIIVVTHNPEFTKYGSRVIYIEDGRIAKQSLNRAKAPEILDPNLDLKYYISSQKRSGLRVMEAIRLSFIHFISKKTRTFLTTVGVALGVAAIVTLVSFGIGLQQTTAKQIASFDALVSINVSTGKNSLGQLDDSLLAKLKQLPNVALVSPTVNIPAKATLNNSSSQIILEGIDKEAIEFEGAKVIAGEKFEGNNQVAISKAAAKNFDIKNSENAVGQKIKIQAVVIPDSSSSESLMNAKTVGIEATVVGVTSDELVSAAYITLGGLRETVGFSKYSALKVKVNNRKNVAPTRELIEKMGFETSSVVDLIDQVDKVFLIAQIVLGVIGGVALLVALLGIANIMTISLLERTHEVGVMKAVGATNKDIKHIFQYEVIFFGLFGGSIGVLSALFFGWGINTFLNYLISVSKVGVSIEVFSTPTIFAIEMVFLTVMVAVLAGWYPTKRASKLSPMEALRYE